VQFAAADRSLPLLAAFEAITWGECADAKTRVRGINLAAAAGAWAEKLPSLRRHLALSAASPIG
jgi:hypothetical protein